MLEQISGKLVIDVSDTGGPQYRIIYKMNHYYKMIDLAWSVMDNQDESLKSIIDYLHRNFNIKKYEVEVPHSPVGTIRVVESNDVHN